MENRGVVADWDEKSRQLTLWDTTQAPIPIRNGTAARLGLQRTRSESSRPSSGVDLGPR